MRHSTASSLPGVQLADVGDCFGGQVVDGGVDGVVGQCGRGGGD